MERRSSRLDAIPPEIDGDIDPPARVQCAARGGAPIRSTSHLRRSVNVSIRKSAAALSVVAMVFAACGGGTASTAPTTGPVATTPAATTPAATAAGAAMSALPGRPSRRSATASATSPGSRPRSRPVGASTPATMPSLAGDPGRERRVADRGRRQRHRHQRPGPGGDPAVGPEGHRRRHPGHRL